MLKIELHFLHNGTKDDVTFGYGRLQPTPLAVAIRERVSKLPAVDTADTKGTTTPDKHFAESTAFSSTPTTGTARKLQFFDTPNTLIFPSLHTNHSDTKLFSTGGEMTFRAGIAAVSKVAPHSIVVYAELTWVANFEGSVVLAKDAKLNMDKPTWSATPNLGTGTSTPTAFSAIAGGADAGDKGFEVWPPNLMNLLDRDPDP